MSDMYDDDEFCHIPDPETPQNCDHCGKVLPRFYRDIICAECDQSLRELKLSRDFRYPYADRG